MKTLTCRSVGGPCHQALSAETWDEMAHAMLHHAEMYHPDWADQIREEHRVAPGKWSYMRLPVWEHAREEYPSDAQASYG